MKNKKPWNKNKAVGAKPPLTPEQTHLIKLLLASSEKLRDQALFALAIDSSFRGSDIIKLKVSDIMINGEMLEVIKIKQQKTDSAVSAYLSESTRNLLRALIDEQGKEWGDFLFTREKGSKDAHITAHRYREILKKLFEKAGLNPSKYGSHSLRRTKTTLIYKKTGNLRACQKILGHKSIQNTANYLGIEEAEALELSKEFSI